MGSPPSNFACKRQLSLLNFNLKFLNWITALKTDEPLHSAEKAFMPHYFKKQTCAFPIRKRKYFRDLIPAPSKKSSQHSYLPYNYKVVPVLIILSNTQIPPSHCMACKHWSFVIAKTNSCTHSTLHIFIYLLMQDFNIPAKWFFQQHTGVLKGLVLGTARHLNKTLLIFFFFNNSPTVACCFER